MGLFDFLRRRSFKPAASSADIPEDRSETGRLQKRLFQEIVLYGRSANPALIQEIQPRYGKATQRLSEEQRMEILLALVPLVEERSAGVQVFFPFLFSEISTHIISTAALHAAATWDPDLEKDPLRGVHALLKHMRANLRLGDETCAVGILKGLLSLGDRRVTEAVGAAWREFSPDGREALTELNTLRVYAPLIGWMLDWLEDCEGDEFGSVAGTLARWGRAAELEGVFEVGRALPVWSRPEDEVITITEEWTVEEFAERIRPRLLQIAANEAAPRIMHEVLRAWGIDHTSRLQSGVVMQPTGVAAAPRDLLAYVSERVSLADGVIDLVPLEDSDFLARDGALLLNWAIFNPRGPTWSCLGLLPTEDPQTSLLFYRMLNPFTQVSGAVGVLRGGGQYQPALLAHIGELFERNRIGVVEGQPVALLESAPTLILPHEADTEFGDELAQQILRSPALHEDHLETATRLIRENYGAPWRRATAEIEAAAAADFEDERASAAASRDARQLWLKLIRSEDHALPELVNFPAAWHGSIDHAGGRPAHHAYTFWQLEEFLSRYGILHFRHLADALADQ